MGDWVADFSDKRKFDEPDDNVEVLGHSPSTNSSSSLPCPSEELLEPALSYLQGSVSPPSPTKPSDVYKVEKPRNKMNWKKRIVSTVSKITSVGRSASCRIEKVPCVADVEPFSQETEPFALEKDELSSLFATSEKEKPRPPSWRKLLSSSMRKTEDKFKADQSLQDYIASWN